MNKQMLCINNQEDEDIEKWVNYSSLTKKYKKARSNLVKLQKLGAFLLHEVDATKMKLHTDLKMRKFDRIIFNFPHAGFHGREDNPLIIKKHRRLVHDFFHNARGMLRLNGEIHVNHKTSAPFCNWNLEELASQNSLVLFDCVPFRIENYPGYNNKRGDSWRCDEPFPLGECSTFKFIFSPGSRDRHRSGWHASGLGMARHDTQSYGLGLWQGQDVLNLVRRVLCARQPTFSHENMTRQTWRVPTQNTEHPAPTYRPVQTLPDFPTQSTAHLGPPFRPVQTLPDVSTQNAAHPTPPYRLAQTRLDVPTQITAHPVTHYSLSQIRPDFPTRNTAHPTAHYSLSQMRSDVPTQNQQIPSHVTVSLKHGLQLAQHSHSHLYPALRC
ncbi:uncharacterized protein LOC130800759 isoform X2 [Amaranthus tricolor]|uniref:uncharacterized protein LOC130800759 isoform X2 n=1 Tax=Amaranthus tricolor TaxID=29722 RepID=UPI002582858E|nr:uncharacterized protein LOC130800759 isoform X2 [Amaranthus tricolor]